MRAGTIMSRHQRRDAFARVLTFVLRHWRHQPRRIAWIAGTIACATTADLAVPFFVGRLVDTLADRGLDRPAALHDATLAFAAIAALAAGAVVFRHLAWMGIVPFTLRILGDVAEASVRHVQRLSSDWHANSFAGSTVRKITRGMGSLDQLQDVILLALWPSAVALCGTTLLFALQWPLLGLVIAVGTSAFATATYGLVTRYVAPAASLSNSWDTRLGGALADTLGCNAVVKAFGAEEREETRIARIVTKWRTRVERTWRRHTRNTTGQLAILFVMRMSVVAVAIALWWRGEASPGAVTYVLTTYFVVNGYLRDVGMHVGNLQRAVNDMEELVALGEEPEGVVDRPGARAIAITRGAIRFDHVTFRYGDHVTALYEDLSVTIRPGERVGLVGYSGSGKTTFVKLIQRLYDVTDGEVLIDGRDIAAATQASLRAQIAVVQQDPILFHRSLADNIAYARPGASMAEIERAAELANAHGFIAGLPKGYATLVGERGVKLSGGERQRVALARAFLADAPILILDEATSSLDSVAESVIQEAIERLMCKRTSLVIAHRLSTVRTMDRILVFDRGRIVEEGSHAALVRRPGGLYRRLFDHQAQAIHA